MFCFFQLKELEQENEDIRLRNLRRVRTEEKLHTSSENCLENGGEDSEGEKVSCTCIKDQIYVYSSPFLELLIPSAGVGKRRWYGYLFSGTTHTEKEGKNSGTWWNIISQEIKCQTILEQF